MFTCLTLRAVHIELVDEMSSSAFINALRRFTAIRGHVKEFRSDRETYFVGATDDLNILCINVEDTQIKDLLAKNKTKKYARCKYVLLKTESLHITFDR